MKSVILSLMIAFAACGSLSAQNIDVINNTTCAVNVTLKAFESVTNLCTIAGATGAAFPFSGQSLATKYCRSVRRNG